jgi:hypothetical protein
MIFSSPIVLFCVRVVLLGILLLLLFCNVAKQAIVNNKIQTRLTLEILCIFLYSESLLEPLVEISWIFF